MNNAIQKIKYNGTMYKVLNGTYYSSKTSDKIIEVLENARIGRVRLRFDYGHDNGQSWGEVNDVTGYVGRSTGMVKIPLLIHNTRSMGGGSILDHCIVKIARSNDKSKVLYQHKNYQPFVQPS